MRKTLSAVLIIVAWVANDAFAQERVPLRRGDTIWGILVDDQGCTQAQAAVLWPLVAQDSDLDPQADRTYPIGTPITINRHCDGRIAGASDVIVVGSEIKSLHQKVVSLTAERDEAIMALSELKLKTQAQGANQRPRTQTDALLEAFAFGGGILASGGVIFLLGWLISRKRKEIPIRRVVVAPEPQSAESENDYPRQICLEHDGKKVSFVRKEDLGSSRVWYECPIDPVHKVASPAKCQFHLRLEHSTRSNEAFEAARVAS